MKKYLAVLFVIILLCGILPTVCASDMEFKELINSVINNSSDMMPKNISMPKKFSITYEYADDGKFREVTMEKDENDNYHYKDREDEYLFVKDGKGYLVAVGNVNGFAYKNNEKYAFNYVKEMTELFWKCATPLDEGIIMGTTTEDGTGEICGRTTNKFMVEIAMSSNTGGISFDVSETTYFDFDAETGICMASSTITKNSINGVNSSDSDINFECTHFELNNVIFPTVE